MKQPYVVNRIYSMANARRKFNEALPNDKARAAHVMAEIQKLYAIERKIAENNMTGNEKLQYRKKHCIFCSC